MPSIVLIEGNNILNVQLVPIPSQFSYVSGINRFFPFDNAFDYFNVDVENMGAVAAVCTLEFYTRLELNNPREFLEWALGATISYSLEPGEVRKFGENAEAWIRACFVGDTYNGREIDSMWVKFVGPPGEIIWNDDCWA